MLSCSLWFTSELNAKDHIEGIHHFQEGHGNRNAGRGFPRRYAQKSYTGESTSATPGGRPPGCFYTTTRDVATGGARFVHCKYKSAIAN